MSNPVFKNRCYRLCSSGSRHQGALVGVINTSGSKGDKAALGRGRCWAVVQLTSYIALGLKWPFRVGGDLGQELGQDDLTFLFLHRSVMRTVPLRCVPLQERACPWDDMTCCSWGNPWRERQLETACLQRSQELGQQQCSHWWGSGSMLQWAMMMCRRVLQTLYRRRNEYINGQ